MTKRRIKRRFFLGTPGEGASRARATSLAVVAMLVTWRCQSAQC